MFRWLGKTNPTVPLILTAPHSGERIPAEASWLRQFDQATLLTDVDRFVHELYEPVTASAELPLLFTEIHRYAADLNRFPDDVDQDSVEGSPKPSGTFSKGFHWVVTTRGARLMERPIPRELHETLVRKYHDAFHAAFAERLSELQALHPGRTLHHLDCHSMPSTGTGAHLDQGQKRADVVISDQDGSSAGSRFKDLVIGAFEKEGLRVSYNWPYKGGRITQRYGQPSRKHETIQIELNRSLYMSEDTREKLPEFADLQKKLTLAITGIANGLGG